MQAGAREAYLIEEPLAAALGAGLSMQGAQESMLVDIGGGTTEVAILSPKGIVASQTIRIAGDEMDEAIVQYIKRRFNLLIGLRTAEEIKMEIGTALDVNEPAYKLVSGRDLLCGLPKTIKINQNQVREAIAEQLATIVEVVKTTLEKIPPELVAGIMDRGIVMTGGTALLRNFDRLIMRATGMTVIVSEDALSCVAMGTGIALAHLDRLSKSSMLKGHK